MSIRADTAQLSNLVSDGFSASIRTADERLSKNGVEVILIDPGAGLMTFISDLS
jgi:hypothetical protein